MFGFFKKKKKDTEGQLGSGGPIITALLLEGDTFPVDAFLQQLSKTRIAGKAVTDISISDGGVFSFSVGDEFFALSVMPAPYPASDLEGPIATTWMWPADPPVENVKQHRTHLLITMMGGAANPVVRRLAITAVTALAAKQPGVMAVLWPVAGLVLFPPVFIGMAEQINSPDAPPLYLWVDLRALRNEDGTTAMFTQGLSDLGHMEIEIPRIEMDPGELREWLLNIMYYLLENGPVLKHGETIGMTAEQKIRIQHVPSKFGHPGKVLCFVP